MLAVEGGETDGEGDRDGEADGDTSDGEGANDGDAMDWGVAELDGARAAGRQALAVTASAATMVKNAGRRRTVRL